MGRLNCQQEKRVHIQFVFLSGTDTGTVGRDKTKEKKKVGHLHIVYYGGG